MGRRRWRDYKTETGARPVRDFMDSLTDEESADLTEAMNEVIEEGLVAARHLRGDIFEIRAGARTCRAAVERLEVPVPTEDALSV